MERSVAAFKKQVWNYYRKHGRAQLPWRQTANPYHVLVSEIMLQQTQVDRVIPKYEAFLRKFPSTRVLAKAPLADVLREWQGLGYNRRAKFLHEAAKVVESRHGGAMPADLPSLLVLPGIGPYTAGAVMAFAYDKPVVFLDTNIRNVFIHHFFPKKQNVHDRELMPIIGSALDRKRPRDWYSALMDYGTHLKATGQGKNARSAHYAKQSRFSGSDREIRGRMLTLLSEKSVPEDLLLKHGSADRLRAEAQLQKLLKEKMVSRKGKTIHLG